jgi:SSS family solute:Na+ symporter
VLAYTLFGGMWSVAWTDFIQMIILVVGLAVIAIFAATWPAAPTRWSPGRQQGPVQVLARAHAGTDMAFFFAAAITMMLGSSRSRTCSSA